MAAELVHNGVPLSEIAGLDPLQLRWVYFRDRDEHGGLIREQQKVVGDDRYQERYKPVTFEEMYRQVKSSQGMPSEMIEEAWQGYLKANPGLVAHMEKRRAAKRRRSEVLHQA